MLLKIPVHNLGSDVIAIPNGLRPRTVITVTGTCGRDRFAINFQSCDQNQRVLHFNPRPQDGVVVRNSFRNGRWEQEERDQPCFPFKAGHEFTITFAVKKQRFKIFVNGEKFAKFEHRLPLSDGGYIQLGGAEFQEVQISDKYTSDYKIAVPGGLNVGKAFRLLGSCSDDKGFALNFLSGNDIAFHFNPRPKEGAVVRNTRQGGNWGGEERAASCFPFQTGALVEVMIFCNNDGFAVFVNNKEFTTFAHRCEFRSISDLQIVGAIDMKMAQFLITMDNDFVIPAPCELGNNESFIFRGFMKKGGNRFAVNFLEGTETGSDIAFHFNPRVNQGEVVMNTRKGGWGEEEKIPLPPVIAANDVFDLKIVTKKRKFKVVLDGKHLCKYKARGEMSSIKGIHIQNGDGVLFHLETRHRMRQRKVFPLPEELSDDTWVIVRGKAKKNATRFHVNFVVGDEEGGDVAFHFNPRFGDKCTVRNNRVQGGWKNEERDQSNFPFQERQDFKITFQVTKDMFVVFVNGNKYIEYKHRVDVSSIGVMELAGDAHFFKPEFL